MKGILLVLALSYGPRSRMQREAMERFEATGRLALKVSNGNW